MGFALKLVLLFFVLVIAFSLAAFLIPPDIELDGTVQPGMLTIFIFFFINTCIAIYLIMRLNLYGYSEAISSLFNEAIFNGLVISITTADVGLSLLHNRITQIISSAKLMSFNRHFIATRVCGMD